MGNTGLSHEAVGATGTIVASPAVYGPIALATKEVPWIKLQKFCSCHPYLKRHAGEIVVT